jgi:molybdate transport system substrate-binding protein
MIRKHLYLLLATVLSVAAIAQTSGKSTSAAKTAAASQSSSAGSELTVAAAADLMPAMQMIGMQYKKAKGVDLKVTYASSGTLATQIEQGAPFDVFMSADMGYPKRLADAKLADPKTLTTYTRGRLVVFVGIGIPDDVAHAGLASLANPQIKKIAIANPEHAPYGKAAVAALKHDNLYEKVQPKLVMAENIAQAAQFVKSGNADAGILSLSAMSDKNLRRRGRISEVDLNAYPPLEQGAIVTKHGAKNPNAADFVKYLHSEMAQGLLARNGFMPSQTSAPANAPKPADKKATPKTK